MDFFCLTLVLETEMPENVVNQIESMPCLSLIQQPLSSNCILFTTLPLEATHWQERLFAWIVTLYRLRDNKKDARLTFQFQPPAKHQAPYRLWDAR
jgi:hypothetical protein